MNESSSDYWKMMFRHQQERANVAWQQRDNAEAGRRDARARLYDMEQKLRHSKRVVGNLQVQQSLSGENHFPSGIRRFDRVQPTVRIVIVFRPAKPLL